MIETGTFLQQRYRIDRQIGQGGMGAVYIATDERFGSTVAIKETLCMDENFRKALEREARLLNSLKHSALPRVSDHFAEDNGQFIVMEYVPGDDVCCMLDPGPDRVTLDQVLKWADQLLDALDYLHNQEIPIIHRDIKPQNLKVTPKGDIILLDFGLAKGNPTDAGHQTAAKSIFGYSRNYASLEQIQGTGTDPRSDLYSLAATLYHLLTATPPDDALTRAMAVLSNKPDPLRPASHLDPGVPRGVAGVLQKAMSLNADERPATAMQMREMLRNNDAYAYLAEGVTVTTPASTSTQGFAGKTELMPEATSVDGQRHTEAKTEILPTNASRVTSVRGGNSPATYAVDRTERPRRSRAFTAAVGAFVLLVAGGAVAGGLYMYDPAIFGEDSPVAPLVHPVVEEKPAPAVADIPANAVNTAETTQAANADPQKSTKEQDTAKSNNPATEKPAGNDDPDNGAADDGIGTSVEVRDVPGGIEIVKTKDGKTTVTHIDTSPKTFRPPTPPNMEMLRKIDPSKLTPEQRRKLRRLLMLHPPANRQPPPSPQQ